jgi:hypothetical protein
MFDIWLLLPEWLFEHCTLTWWKVEVQRRPSAVGASFLRAMSHSLMKAKGAFMSESPAKGCSIGDYVSMRILDSTGWVKMSVTVG